MRKRALQKKLLPAPRKEYYDPSTGIMTLHPAEDRSTFGEGLSHAMARLGGKEGLAHWAKYNPSHFYTLMARTLPLELAGKDGGPIEISFIDPVAREKEVKGV